MGRRAVLAQIAISAPGVLAARVNDVPEGKKFDAARGRARGALCLA